MGLGLIIIFFDLGVRGGTETMFRLWIRVTVFVTLREREADHKPLANRDKEEPLSYLHCIFIPGEKYWIVLFILLYLGKKRLSAWVPVRFISLLFSNKEWNLEKKNI